MPARPADPAGSAAAGQGRSDDDGRDAARGTARARLLAFRTMRRRELLLALGALWAGRAGAAEGREIEVFGEAVCLVNGEPGPPGACAAGDPFGIRSPDGTIHRLDPADPRVEILTDARVHVHPLEVALWEEDGLGKIIRLHTVQDGQAIEPYYFCFTCNITAHLPGPCWCCQQEFEFKERPARTPDG